MRRVSILFIVFVTVCIEAFKALTSLFCWLLALTVYMSLWRRRRRKKKKISSDEQSEMTCWSESCFSCYKSCVPSCLWLVFLSPFCFNLVFFRYNSSSWRWVRSPTSLQSVHIWKCDSYNSCRLSVLTWSALREHSRSACCSGYLSFLTSHHSIFSFFLSS